MSEIFFSADLHIGHRRIAEEFKAEDGSPLRPFKNMEEHDQALINRINSTVGRKDRLFILGDIAWTSAGARYLGEIRCENVIAVLGNHDKHGLMKLHLFKGSGYCLLRQKAKQLLRTFKVGVWTPPVSSSCSLGWPKKLLR